MIETIVLNYLSNNLSVPVYMEEPETKPVSYVVLEKTGSQKANLIETATIAAQSYGASLYDAAALNAEVKHALEDMEEIDAVGSVKLNSDYNFTDPETKRYRYQCVYNIVFYEEG